MDAGTDLLRMLSQFYVSVLPVGKVLRWGLSL